MYSKFGFKLEWYEIDEELREQKIDEQIAYDFENNGDSEFSSVEEAQLDNETRRNAESSISARFPVYF